MTNHGIEALAAQRIGERRAEAERARLGRMAATRTEGTPRRRRLPSLPWLQPRPASRPA